MHTSATAASMHYCHAHQCDSHYFDCCLSRSRRTCAARRSTPSSFHLWSTWTRRRCISAQAPIQTSTTCNLQGTCCPLDRISLHVGEQTMVCIAQDDEPHAQCPQKPALIHRNCLQCACLWCTQTVMHACPSGLPQGLRPAATTPRTRWAALRCKEAKGGARGMRKRHARNSQTGPP